MKLELANISVRLPGMNKPLFAVKSHVILSGARTLIQGPSGQGKTTLLHLLAGLVEPSAGAVSVGEQNLVSLSDAERTRFRRDHIGLIFQKLSLISHLTSRENVQLGLPASGSSKQVAERIDRALTTVKLNDQADVLAQNLSLGQAQRVAVARVLAQAPAVVLADEPTSSLDDANAEAVIQALLALAPTTTIVVVSHDHRLRPFFKDVCDFKSLVRT